MRFMLYNIRYGTGGKPGQAPWRGYLRKTEANLAEIIRFIEPLDPDIIGLVEVDGGSFRSGKQSQSQIIAEAVGHYHSYGCKYNQSFVCEKLPVLRHQGNAFLTKQAVSNEQFHYFEKGLKRLVIEVELDNLVIFLVHLALGFRARHAQLADLYSLVRQTHKPHIVAGDFNVFSGDKEIRLFCGATGLENANEVGLPTFPSGRPKRQLDFILHSPELKPSGFQIPQVHFSDHLPLICDFEIQ
jgi:endonuclease/exonuclease/phosphatase family metal-dependent hydrolase